jgi:hypothetical protein
MEKSAGFNARETHAFTSDTLYRMYVVEGQLYCIRLAGQAGFARGAAAGLRAQLGLVGAVVGHLLKSSAAQNTQEAAQQLDRRDPKILLKAKEGSFVMTPGAIVEAALEPSAAYQAHGDQYGRLLVRGEDGKKTTYQFETLEDMHRAVQLLPAVFGSKLTVNVEWSDRAKEYVKRKA